MGLPLVDLSQRSPLLIHASLLASSRVLPLATSPPYLRDVIEVRRSPTQSARILFVLTLCMENVINACADFVQVNALASSGPVGIDPVALTHHDMVVEVLLQSCMVQDVAISLRLKDASLDQQLCQLSPFLVQHCNQILGEFLQNQGSTQTNATLWPHTRTTSTMSLELGPCPLVRLATP